MRSAFDVAGGVDLPSLEGGTQTVADGLRVRLWPTAGECVITRNGLPDSRASTLRRSRLQRFAPTVDPDANAQRAARRARGRLRRYCKANRLLYLWTNTYAVEPDSVGDVQDDWRRFRRRCRRAGVGGPWVRVFERGEGNDRLHVHWATDHRIEHAQVHELWGAGHVWVNLHRPGSGDSSGRQAAGVARYLSAYLAKEGLGTRAYDVARGFQPAVVELVGPDLRTCVERVSDEHFAGAAPSYVYRSDHHEGHQGPPCVFVAWEGVEHAKEGTQDRQVAA